MPKATPKTELPHEPASYEAALEELEQLVTRIESGQMPLDQMLAGYQRGATLLAFCRQRLDAGHVDAGESHGCSGAYGCTLSTGQGVRLRKMISGVPACVDLLSLPLQPS